MTIGRKPQTTPEFQHVSILDVGSCVLLCMEETGYSVSGIPFVDFVSRRHISGRVARTAHVLGVSLEYFQLPFMLLL